jgi:hypothetical protein
MHKRLSHEALTEFRGFVAEAWYEACGRTSDDHLSAGTQVKRIQSRRDWDRLSKYVAKKEELQEEEEEEPQKQSVSTGRMWGKWNKDLFPIA